MAARTTTIEFLPQEEWEKKPIGKFLKWALTVGRYIVITTELIVILAFLSRFKLDRDLTDLNENVKQKQAIVASSTSLEKNFRFLQKRLAAIEKLRKSQLEAEGVLNELASLTPIDVSFSDLAIKKREVNLTAIALSEAGLATFLNNLKSSPRLTNLSVSRLTLGDTEALGIKFQLSSKLVLSNGL